MQRYLLYAPLAAYWSMALAVALDLFPNQTLLLLGGALAASAVVLNLTQPADAAERGLAARNPRDQAG
jgi:hypothetical protein